MGGTTPAGSIGGGRYSHPVITQDRTLHCRHQNREDGSPLPSTKETTLPAGPPILRRAPAALEMAGPAEAETLERPSEALEAAEEAVSPALEAASEVDEACLTAALRVRNCDCRRTARVTGILKGEKEWTKGIKRKTQSLMKQYSPMVLSLAQRQNQNLRICRSGTSGNSVT